MKERPGAPIASFFAVLIAATLIPATIAAASPSGTITVGQRISTGQLTAQFYAASDLHDPTYGGVSWYPSATLAAPGEPCVASSSAVVYVGQFMDGPGWQRSALEAFYADAGTLCLWVNADVEYLVATAGVPSSPPPSAPTVAAPPAPAPAPDHRVLSMSEARIRLVAYLRRTYGEPFTLAFQAGRYMRSCERVDDRRVRCAVRWWSSRSVWSGSVTVRAWAGGYTFSRDVSRRPRRARSRRLLIG